MNCFAGVLERKSFAARIKKRFSRSKKRSHSADRAASSSLREGSNYLQPPGPQSKGYPTCRTCVTLKPPSKLEFKYVLCRLTKTFPFNLAFLYMVDILDILSIFSKLFNFGKLIDWIVIIFNIKIFNFILWVCYKVSTFIKRKKLYKFYIVDINCYQTLFKTSYTFDISNVCSGLLLLNPTVLRVTFHSWVVFTNVLVFIFCILMAVIQVWLFCLCC